MGRHPTPRWADQIDIAAIDAFRGYANAIGDMFPTATLVIDHFHAIRLTNEAISDVRRRVQQDTVNTVEFKPTLRKQRRKAHDQQLAGIFANADADSGLAEAKPPAAASSR